MSTSLVSLLLSATDIAESEIVAEDVVEPKLLVPGLLLVAFMVIGLITVWGGVYLAMRWRAAMPRAAAVNKKTLLDRLAALHGLSADDVAQLRTVATQSALADAALVLIDPRVLESYVVHDPAMSSWAAQMGERLFGGTYVVSHAPTTDPAQNAVGVG